MNNEEILYKLNYIVERTESDSLIFDYAAELENHITNLQKENEKAIQVYDETINYLTTINTEFMDRYTKMTIKEMIKNLEKELNTLQGSDKE